MTSGYSRQSTIQATRQSPCGVAGGASGGSSMGSELFASFQTLIYKEAGIWLGAHKTTLLQGRLTRRLRVLGLANMAEYYHLVTKSDQQHERAMMIDCITTNETHFFREPRHFDFLAQRIFARWKKQAAEQQRGKRIRIWSAGCSTGEEPYSLAMLLLKHFSPEAGWDMEVLASDISTRVLEKARIAIFSMDRSTEIPNEFLRSYMLKGTGEQEGLMKVCPEARKLVRFARLNLLAQPYPFTGLFDLVFCRNVLIYFDQDSKQRAVENMAHHLSPQGLLFVGHSENLNRVTARLKNVAPTIYSLAESERDRPPPSLRKTSLPPFDSQVI
jgi:chemotaxis protein methyltransferase CheR